jgi:acyl-coenzyme A thioesterase PaaI-like protein
MDIVGIMAGGRASGETRKAVTVNLNCNFLSTAMGETVHAEGRIIRKGRSMFFSDVRVVDAESGKIYSSGQGAYKYL